MSKYHRKPSIVVEKPSDYAFAFTMRLLNFLGDFEIWKRKNLVIVPRVVENYAWRITERLNPPVDD